MMVLAEFAIGKQTDNCAKGSNNYGPQIETINTTVANKAHYKAANNGTNNS